MATSEENDKKGVVMAGNTEEKVFEFQQEHEVEFPCIIPASCNWYSTNIISCFNGYCLVGGKNAVFIMTLHKHPPVFEWDMFGSPKLNVKVTAVAIIGTEQNIKPTFPELIGVGLEDGLSRIINTKSKSIVKEHRNHKVKITAMSWSPVTPKTILTADLKGNLSVWDYEENSIQMWTPIPSQIICLQMSPLKSALFVAGYQNGNIIVGDSNQLVVLSTLKSHNDEVTSLSWCPVSTDGRLCFASASKDRTIRLWEITEEKSFGVLSPPKFNYGKKKEFSKQNFFHTVLWLNEAQIVSGTHNGDLLCWDNNGKNNIIGSAHDRVIFTLSCDQLTNQFVSVSMDRQIIVWDGNSARPAYKIPSFGGFVYSLSTSLNNPYTVAIGVGDNIIRVLSIGDSNSGYEYTNLWEGIKSKITVLALHPSYEGIVGYGTEDGHVGCCSINSKKSDISISYHKKCVYSLAWGPVYSCEDFTEDKVKINCLYTVGGEGTVLMHKMGSLNNDAYDIGKLIKSCNNLSNVPSRSDIAWRVDYKYFVLSNADGTIDLFETNTLKSVCTANCHKKMVNTMAWHHNYSYNEAGTCYSNWLASGSNEDVLCVTDFSDAISNHSKEARELEVLRPSKQLFGHGGRITRLVWNPHKNAILASASFDGSVRIWDVEVSTTLATFNGHLGRVYSLAWSYLNGDVVYSGGEDFTLRRWNISHLSGDDTSSRRKKRTKKKKSDYLKEDSSTQNMDTIEETITTLNDGSNDDPKDNKCKQSVQSVDLTEVVVQRSERVDYDSNANVRSTESLQQRTPLSPEITVNVVPREPKPEGGRKRRVRSVLKKTSALDGKPKERMQQDCISLATYLKAQSEDETTCKEKSGVDPTREENIDFSLFTTRGDAYSLLSSEIRSHEENQMHDQMFYLEMWRNNIGGLLDKAVENSSLNDTLVALAPLGGYDMWKATLLAYAEQLEKQKKMHMSAVYYLAAGEVYKAVNVLKENGYLKEALVLAKVQLGCNDPIVQEISLLRANKLAKECQFEHAAECFLAAGCVEDAITILAKRGDSASLLTSLKVAEIYNVEKHSSYLYRLTCAALYKEHKWRTLHEQLSRYNKIELLHFQAVVGEFLVEHMFETDLIQDLYFAVQNHKSFKHFTDRQQKFPSYITRTEDSSSSSTPSFLMSLLCSLEESCNFTKETYSDFKHIDFQQFQCGRARATHPNVNDLWNELINSVLYGVVYLVNGDCTKCFKQWLSILNILEHSGYPSSVLLLFDLLFPKHYVSFNEIIQLFHSSECGQSYISQAFNNFMAFKCSGILYHIWYQTSSHPLTMQSDKSVIGSGESERKLSPCEDSSQSSYEFYCVKEDLYFCLTWLSSILLSGTHASYVLLQSEINSIDERLLELDIKKRLNEHILSRKPANSKNSATSCTQMNNKEEDVASVVNQLCEHMVNVVVKVDTTSHVDVPSRSGKPGMLQGHLENEMLACYLRGRKRDLSETLRSYPSDIIDYAFPQTTVSFRILMLLCLIHKSSDERIGSLFNDIAAWGKSHDIYATNYIERLITQN